jgi:hypothetical protein
MLAAFDIVAAHHENKQNSPDFLCSVMSYLSSSEIWGIFCDALLTNARDAHDALKSQGVDWHDVAEAGFVNGHNENYSMAIGILAACQLSSTAITRALPAHFPQIADIPMSKELRLETFNALDKHFRIVDCLTEPLGQRQEALYFCKMSPSMNDEIRRQCSLLAECNKVGDDIVKAWTSKAVFKTIDPESSDIVIVNQRQYAVASGENDKDVLITADIMKCVGLALYSKRNNRGGVAHLDGENIRNLDAYLEGKHSGQDDLSDLQLFLIDVACGAKIEDIEVTIVSGYAPHINYLREYLQILGVKKITIHYDARWGDAANSYYNHRAKGSLALHCKTGEVVRLKNEEAFRMIMGPPPGYVDGQVEQLRKLGK